MRRRSVLLAPQSGALRISAYRDFHPIPNPILPLIAFEHLSLFGSLWKGRSWQTKAEPGTAGHSQVKPGTTKYSHVQCWKDPSFAIFLKSRRFEDIKYDTTTWGPLGDHLRTTWGPVGDHLGTTRGPLGDMSGVSYRVCLRHVWGMSVVSSGACFGHHLGYHVGMSGSCLGHVLGNLRYPRCYIHHWCHFPTHYNDFRLVNIIRPFDSTCQRVLRKEMMKKMQNSIMIISVTECGEHIRIFEYGPFEGNFKFELNKI